MTHNGWKHGLLFMCVLSLTACASTLNPPAQNGGLFRQRNEGYSLLYKLMSDDGDVGKILIIKQADDSVSGIVKEIGAFCQASKKEMDGFPKSDSRIVYGVSNLPDIEQKSRDLQASDDTNALLFSSGKTFELRLIFTQAEAMNYATQLSKALAEHEDDAARKSFLNNLAHRCSDFHDRLMNLLAVKS